MGFFGGQPPKKAVYRVMEDLLFPEKEAKRDCSGLQKVLGARKLPRSRTRGVWGLAPKKGVGRVF
jgi:hypothetical protein